MKRIAYFTAALSALLFLVTLCSCDPTESSGAGNKGRLSIEAQIIYKTGGPQPAARDTFCLLDADLLNVEMPQTLKGDNFLKSDVLDREWVKLTPAQKLKYLIVAALVVERQRQSAQAQGIDVPEQRPIEGGNIKSILLLIEQLRSDRQTAHHFIQVANTDFQGRTTFENVEPGDYWIMGATQTRSDFAFWNYKVTIKPGENKVLLDQNNALYSK